jgi:hypothetical protein
MSISNLAQATASNTGMPIGIEEGQKTFRLFGTFKLTGNYATTGDPFDILQLFTAAAGGPGASILTGSLPLKVEFQSVKSGAQANTFFYQYNPGTTLSNGTIQVFTGAAAQTGLTELSAGAYPAGVTADTISFEIVLPKI